MAGKNLRTTSIGALAREYYENGPKAAAEVLSKVPHAPRDEIFFQHLRPSDGQRVMRTEPGAETTVKYFKFDPPPDWENPYQVMKVEVNSSHETDYLSHTGEEYLLPIDGPGVLYRFYWAEPGEHSLPQQIKVQVDCGRVIRITAEVPHSATGAGHSATKAWMITRPIQESAPSIYLDPMEQRRNKRRTDTAEKKPDWSDPAVYALRAWSVSEQIRLQRVKNNLRIKDVADRIPINASHLSKIEEARETANPTLETLRKIGDVLDLDIAELVSPPTKHSWLSDPIYFDVDPQGSARQVALFSNEPMRQRLIEKRGRLPLKKHWNDHFVHLQRWRFEKDAEHVFHEKGSRKKELGDLRWSSTWIVLEGMVKVYIEFAGTQVEEALLSESVLHIRGGGPRLKKIEASENTVIVQVNYSRDPAECNCKRPNEDSPR